MGSVLDYWDGSRFDRLWQMRSQACYVYSQLKDKFRRMRKNYHDSTWLIEFSDVKQVFHFAWEIDLPTHQHSVPI